MKITSTAGIAAAWSILSLPAGAPHAQEPDPAYKNLRVLPENVTAEELSRTMLENLRGLGLPRRQSEGCLYCHVGDMEEPVSSWDFASDAKLAKRKARRMMAMVQEINGKHLQGLESRQDPPLRVTCQTCHAGRLDPRPLPEVLRSVLAGEGVGRAIEKYRELRDRYHGAGAYDFRAATLSGLAHELAAGGSFDDALALASVNAEVFPDLPAARQTVVLLELQRAAEERGVEAAVAEFDEIRTRESAAVVTHGILDALGWGLYRRDRQDEALVLFRKNLSAFPEEYIPHESLGDALWFHGDREAGIRRFQAWLASHPDHEMARRRLTNMTSELAAAGGE